MRLEKYIGIDIGGTNTRIVQSTSLKVPVLEKKVTFPTSGNFESDFQNITAYINKVETPIQGIGIGIPGDLSDDKSRVAYAINLPDYINKPISVLLAQKYGCKVQVDNDAVTAAIGQALFGNSQKDDFIFIVWGTGIGGASIVYQENKPKATQINWQTFLKSWEEVCGGKSLNKLYGKPTEDLGETEWNEIMNKFSVKIQTLSGRLKTKKIIFGGGIAIKQAARLKQLITQFQQNLNNKLPVLAISQLGENAGLYGSLSLLNKSAIISI